MDFVNNFQDLKVLIAPFVAIILSAYSLPVIINVAKTKNLVDIPNERTSHVGSIPNLGGMGIFIGFVFSVLLFMNINQFPQLQYIIFGVTAIFFVGLRDDIAPLSPSKKLVAEILIIVLVILLSNVRFTSLHGFLQQERVNFWFGVPITLFVCIVIINSLNLIDGIDGLASGISFIVLTFLGVYFLLIGGESFRQLAIMSFCMAGALVPFFIYNVFGSVHKIFMGDTGSLILGFIITFLIIEFNEINSFMDGPLHIQAAPAFSINLLIVPIFDTVRVFVLRIISRKSPFRADKNHIHHRLIAANFTHIQATLILMGVTILFIIIGLLGKNLPILGLLGIDLIVASSLMQLLIVKVRKVKNAGQQTEKIDIDSK